MLHSTNTDTERFLFLEGSNAYAYRFLGAHPTQGGWVFRVWAPGARAVSLCGDFNGWDAKDCPMQPGEGGIWSVELAGVKALTAYKFAVTGKGGSTVLKADPYAFHAETRPGTASKTFDISGFEWTDGEWMRARAAFDAPHSPVNIYELHIGSWRRDEQGRVYTYERVADELPAYLKDLGYTHVELMPLTEYPLDESWGYQVTGYFAPTSRYGTPFGLMHLIDRLHAAGIGVIMDWVPAHFPRDEFGLARFDGGALYEYADPRMGDNPQWGTHTFDFGRGAVRSFLLSSAMLWLREYHLDGLRVDAVSYMLYRDYCREGQGVPLNRYGGRENLEAISLLQKLNELAYRDCPGVMMMAEEATAFPMVTRPKYIGGLGFGFKWDMGWMNDTLDYMRLDPIYRSYHHDKLTFSMMYAFRENYVMALSHDEVAHGKHSLLDKMPGDYWRKFAGLRVLYGYQYSHPGKKLLFMGGEFGQFIEWKDGDQLDWLLYQYPTHCGLRDWVRAVNLLYRDTPAFWRVDESWEGFLWLNPNDAPNSVISFIRRDGMGGQVICLHNFTPQYLPQYRVPLPGAGLVTPLLCSDEERFGGSGKGAKAPCVAGEGLCCGMSHYFDTELAPMASMFFAYEQFPAQEADEEADAPGTVKQATEE